MNNKNNCGFYYYFIIYYWFVRFIQDIKSYGWNLNGEFPYPIIADPTRQLAIELDMIDEQDRHDPDVANTVRALYIIDPSHKLRLSMIYPNSTGRNIK